jgi:hypothetical protein
MFGKKKNKVVEEMQPIGVPDKYGGRILNVSITAVRDSMGFWNTLYSLCQGRLYETVWDYRTKAVTSIDRNFQRGVNAAKAFMDGIMEGCGYSLFDYFEKHPDEDWKGKVDDKASSNEITPT